MPNISSFSFTPGIISSLNNSSQALVSSYEIYREVDGVYRWRYWNSVGQKIAESSLTYGGVLGCKQDVYWIQKSEYSTIILGEPSYGGVNNYLIYKDFVNYQLIFRWRFRDSSGRNILRSSLLRKTHSDCYKDIY